MCKSVALREPVQHLMRRTSSNGQVYCVWARKRLMAMGEDGALAAQVLQIRANFGNAASLVGILYAQGGGDYT